MKKFIMIFISIYIGLIVFMPKEEFIFTLLNNFSKQRVNFQIEQLQDFAIYEDITDVDIIYDTMKVAHIEDIKLYPWLFYNRLSISTIEPLKNFKKMLNLVVISADLSYSIFSPFSIYINAKTTIGDISGRYDIKTSKIKIFLIPNKKFKLFRYRRYFKREKGGYIYESIIR